MVDFEKVKNIKEFAKLASEIWHEYWTVLLSPEQIDYMVEKFQSENAVTRQIEQENYTYFYILENGEKAGYIGLSEKNDYLFLSKLYLKKDFRHKGLGTKAFEFIKDFARNSGFDKIVLTVNKYNSNTIKAYEKWGFKSVDAVVTDIGGGFVMDDFIMEFSL
ncbi:MAG: GNAT family N-acetyltransferase [Candidatus Gastranaerophilaceae bacterium]